MATESAVSGAFNTVIIGAGASGLAAAAELARAGRSAVVLEARERIGGRIWSHHEPGLPVPVELGAEFIHGRSDTTFALLEKAATAALDCAGRSRGERWTLREGKLAPSDDLFAEIRYAMKRMPGFKRDISFDTFLVRYLRKELSAEACAFARTLAEGYDAVDTKRASARAIIEEWTGGGSVEMPQFRPMGGYGPLLSHLASQLHGTRVELQLNTVVKAVRWARGSVKVEGTFLGRPFHARAKRAIVTLPIAVLQIPASAPGAVRFAPALSAKRAALRHLELGRVVKTVLRFRTAFWEKLDGGRYRNVAFFHPRQEVFPTFWTALPVRTPLLVAWAGGPKAAALSNASKPEIIEHALTSLTALFQDRAKIENELEAAWVRARCLQLCHRRRRHCTRSACEAARKNAFFRRGSGGHRRRSGYRCGCVAEWTQGGAGGARMKLSRVSRPLP
jgi:monoamine oxidase